MHAGREQIMEESVITVSKEMRGAIYDTARRCAEEGDGKREAGGDEKKVEEAKRKILKVIHVRR